jgi:hypothetical protein
VPTTSSVPVMRSWRVTALASPPLTTDVLPASAKHASRTAPGAYNRGKVERSVRGRGEREGGRACVRERRPVHMRV